MRVLATLVLLSCTVGGCGTEGATSGTDRSPAPTSVSPPAGTSGLNLADWQQPVAEGTRVLNYRGVPFDDRLGSTITVEPELVVGGDTADPRSLFYHAQDIGVDAAGRMYVLDSGNFRIQVFDRYGGFVRSIGKEGQGPGEFGSPSDLEIVGDQVFVWDRRKRRIVTWDLEGNPGAEITLEGVGTLAPTHKMHAISVADDLSSLLVSSAEIHRSPDGRYHPREPTDYLVRRFTLAGARGVELLRKVGVWSPFYERHPLLVEGKGIAYVSHGDEYQIHAFSPEGAALWALRVDWLRESNEVSKDRMFAIRQRQHPERSTAELRQEVAEDFPGEYLAALTGMFVDGHEHLHVVPLLQDREKIDRLRESLPPDSSFSMVDVFTPDGVHVFSGITTIPGWLKAVGEYVYYFDWDPETSEQLLVRGVLREPFD